MKKALLFVGAAFLVLGLFAFANDNNETGDHQQISDHTGASFTGLSSDAITCTTTAIVKRDTAIKWWMDVYHTAWTATMDARTAAFTAALSLTNKKAMKKAIDAAWKTSEKAMKAAQKVKKAGVQTIWNTYRKDLKACNADIAKGLMQERGGNDLDD